MTIQFKCDGPGCSRVLSKDERRIGLSVHEPPTPLTPMTFDPDDDPEGLRVATVDLVNTFDFEIGDLKDKHFCSEPCLVSWGYSEQLERMETP